MKHSEFQEEAYNYCRSNKNNSIKTIIGTRISLYCYMAGTGLLIHISGEPAIEN